MSNINLGEKLKFSINERKMSLRLLSQETGIDKSTLSRIITGKRQANIKHLNKLSRSLDIPIIDLLKLAGYTSESKKNNEQSELGSSTEEIKNILQADDCYKDNFSVDAVSYKLKEYEAYAQTKDGVEKIYGEFNEKLDKVESSGSFIKHLQDFYSEFTNSKSAFFKSSVMGGALLYFIIPVDVIPDWIFPIGYIDDALAVKLALKSLNN